MVGLVAQWVERATLIYEDAARLINPDPGNPDPTHWYVPNGEDAIRKAFDLMFKDSKSALQLLSEMQDSDDFGGLFVPADMEAFQFEGDGRFELSWLEFVRYVLFVQYEEYPGLQANLFPEIDKLERELYTEANRKSREPDSIKFVPIPA